MDAIKADNSVLKATVLYPPTMAASAIDLARALGQGKGVSGLAELEIPASITLYSAVVDQGQRRPVPAHRLQLTGAAAAPTEHDRRGGTRMDTEGQ